MSSIIKLPLNHEEKSKLRKAKIEISELHTFTVDHISELLDIPLEKAKTLKGLAEFQTIPSIGYKLAEKLVFQLKLYSLTEIKDKDAAHLFDQLEQQLGVWTDSCVEDQIRCVIHYAKNQNSNKQWFDFTEERKMYREKYGFPETRPTKAWFDKE